MRGEQSSLEKVRFEPRFEGKAVNEETLERRTFEKHGSCTDCGRKRAMGDEATEIWKLQTIYTYLQAFVRMSVFCNKWNPLDSIRRVI